MDDEIELSFEKLWRFARTHWGKLSLAMILGAISGIGATLLTEPEFQARAVLAEKRNRMLSEDSTARGLGSLGSISNVLSGSPEQSADLTQYIYLLRSFETARKIRGDDTLLNAMFPTRWSTDKQAWQFNKPSLPGLVVRFLLQIPQAPSAKPSVSEIQEYLERNVTLTNMKNDGFWIVKYRHIDQEVAITLLTKLFDTADQIIRSRDQHTLGRQAAYIEERAKLTTENPHRLALYSILESLERRIMLLESDQTYAFDFVDNPSVSEVARRRYAQLFLLGGTVLGMLLGIFFSMATSIKGIKNEKDQTADAAKYSPI